MQTANTIIKELNLEPLAEGGHFKRIFESSVKDSQGRRNGAAIYYLLTAPEFSCFHRVDCDELWHFYAGNPITLYQIDPHGQLTQTLVGNPLEHKGASPVVIVEKGKWFAAEIVDNIGFSLVGCTTTPEFLFEAYDIGNTERLSNQYPQHRDLISRLTFQEKAPHNFPHSFEKNEPQNQ